MHFAVLERAIPLLDPWQDRSSVPAKFWEAAAHCGDQRGSPDKRGSASFLTAASTAASCRLTWMLLSAVVAFAIAICVTGHQARGEQLSIKHASSPAGDYLDGFIAEASEHFGLPAAWICAIICLESGGNASTMARNGAVGFNATWPELRPRYALGDDLLDPRDRLLAGAAHLGEMYDRHGPKGFLAADSMGPTRYDQLLKTDAPLPSEVQAYVSVLAPLIEPGLKDAVGAAAPSNVISWRKAPLFVGQTVRCSGDRPIAPGVPAERLSKSQTSTDGSLLMPRADGLFARRGMEARSQ